MIKLTFRFRALPASALAVLAAAATTLAQDHVTTFDAGNIGGWTYGPPPSFPSSGGNPGPYLRTSGIDTFAPILRTTGDSVFTGDYRARRVTGLSVDLRTFAAMSTGGRPLSLILVDDNGTPANFNDDWGLYRIGATNIPSTTQGWVSYSFEIPSDAAAVPAGWSFVQFGSGSPSQPNWDALITDVDQVRFFYGHPEGFFIFQLWDIGADNLGIDTLCPADHNADGVVDTQDVSAFLSDWFADIAGGTLVTDFDGNGTVSTGDLSLFLSAWFAALAGGC
ncbi:MAG TPA: hypothetical protein VD963_09320 [Phycisphaerales bacterium]|nr:hypothetical protein [Phycisphaerales bacterium]